MVDEKIETPPEGEQAPEGDQAVETEQVDRRQERDRKVRLKLKSDLDEAKAWRHDREQADAKATEERQREAGEFTKLEEGLRTQNRDLQEQLDEAVGKIDGAAKDKRQGKFLDAIMKEGGLTNRSVAAALLPTLGLEDTSPENFTKRDVREARKALHETAPELFGKAAGNSPPPPGGGNKPIETDSDEYFAAKALAYSTGQLSTAYEKATGRAGNTS